MALIARRPQIVARPNEPPQPDPLAFFLTWPTYGTWLPGDPRGWVEYQHGWRTPDPIREFEARAMMTEDACVLDVAQRRLVEETIRDHCQRRGWHLYAVNCRTNHLHVVVAAPANPKQVRGQLKAWCTRRLKELETARLQVANDPSPVRAEWWAERGSRRWINDEASLEAATNYVRDGQD